MNKKSIVFVGIFVIVLLALKAGLGLAAGSCDSTDSKTTVPGHCDKDGPVVGHYTSLYAYDANGDWYWDQGDGRVVGTVDFVDDLDQDTLTTCDYVVNPMCKFNIY